MRDPERQQQRLNELIGQLQASAIAIHTDAANEQHYTMPARFFELVLGDHLKYSCCYYRPGVDSLEQAEEDMLALTAERACLQDGDRILELGCGWGSLTLWMAERFPTATIVAVSNSSTQRTYIQARAAERGIDNIQVITADVSDLDFDEDVKFDRVVSVEMFEHVRNYARLLEKIARWMTAEATLFVHIFCHSRFAYPFEVRDESDWMARYFFTGGLMPSADLLLYFQDDVRLREHWQVDGTHYQRTSEDWLRNMDRHRNEILSILAEVYGTDQAVRWLVYWRVFFMACAELFGHRDGREWLVSHYLFKKSPVRVARTNIARNTSTIGANSRKAMGTG